MNITPSTEMRISEALLHTVNYYEDLRSTAACAARGASTSPASELDVDDYYCQARFYAKRKQAYTDAYEEWADYCQLQCRAESMQKTIF